MHPTIGDAGLCNRHENVTRNMHDRHHPMYLSRYGTDRVSAQGAAMSLGCWARSTLAAAMLAGAMPQAAAAQDMLRFLDLKSDDFTKAAGPRAGIEVGGA